MLWCNRAEKKRKDFMKTHNMKFNGYGGLCIHSLVVSEFGYLLRYLTDGKVDSFDDFEKIVETTPLIHSSAKHELEKNVLKEEENLKISHELATRNIQKLLDIVECINKYVDLCKREEIPLIPDK